MAIQAHQAEEVLRQAGAIMVPLIKLKGTNAQRSVKTKTYCSIIRNLKIVLYVGDYLLSL
jgi:hypothetical protein